MELIYKVLIVVTMCLCVGCSMSSGAYAIPDVVIRKYTDGSKINYVAFSKIDLNDEDDYLYEFVFFDKGEVIEVDRRTGDVSNRRKLSPKEIRDAREAYKELLVSFLNKNIVQ